ncbi:MAG: ribosomal protection-like ABC-F family protein [Chloroflexota bacterium]
MSVLTISKLSVSFGPLDVFDDISAAIPNNGRVALIGPNGGGKTSLLRVIVGEEKPQAGAIHVARGTTIGYLPQESEHALHTSTGTVFDEMLSCYPELTEMEAKLQTMHDVIGKETPEDTVNEYLVLLDRFQEDGGYTYQHKIKYALTGVGFTEQEYSMPVAHLSGGQKTRLLLASLVLQQPTLLILDEPTNHLDLLGIEWLESELMRWPGAVILVSHDRYFLDRVVNTIWDLDNGRLKAYRGNYTSYVTQREEDRLRQERVFQRQQKKIQKEEDFIRRNIAGQRTKEAQGRLKRLERFKRDEMIAAPSSSRMVHARLSSARRSGDLILDSKDLVIGYDKNQPLLAVDDMDFRRLERAAIIGPNGTGKTSFLRTIMRQIEPLSGNLRLGASLDIGYYSQNREELDLSTDRTVLDEYLHSHYMPESQARNILGAFLFSGDQVYSRISQLSGGERSRLSIAILLHKQPNLLILDEPTNHLDIPTQEVLERQLADFDGTVILVSHDRYLIDRLATQIWSVNHKRLQVFRGNYQELVESNKLSDDASHVSVRQSRRQSRKPQIKPKDDRGDQLRLMENQVMSLEGRIAEIDNDISLATAAQDWNRVQQLTLERRKFVSDLEMTLDEWANMSENIQ